MISPSLHMFSTKLAHQLSCTTCGLLWDIFLYYLWFCLGVKCDDILFCKEHYDYYYHLYNTRICPAIEYGVFGLQFRCYIYNTRDAASPYFEICFLRLIQMTSARIIGISFYGTHGPGKNNVVKPSSISFLQYYYLHYQ